MVTKNATTDSPWPISNNPDARYNDPTRQDCNLQIPLWQLVRASTAAPVYFPPEILQWDPHDKTKTFVFVDGGITPHNNPAFLLYRMATSPAYRLNWKTGEKNLLLVSVGTGAAESMGATASSPNKNIVSTITGLSGALMYAIQVEQDINCRAIGRCTYGSRLDREMHDMVPREAGSDITSPADSAYHRSGPSFPLCALQRRSERAGSKDGRLPMWFPLTSRKWMASKTWTSCCKSAARLVKLWTRCILDHSFRSVLESLASLDQDGAVSNRHAAARRELTFPARSRTSVYCSGAL